MPTKTVNLMDVNPLERITGDVAISQYNYESVMNGLVQWDQSHTDKITIRLATRTDPYFVDYTIPTKYFYDKNYGSVNSSVLLPTGNFAYKNRVKFAASIGDPVTLRINATDVGDTKWAVYANAAVYDEVESIPYEEDGQVIENMFLVRRPTNFVYTYDKAGLYFRILDTANQSFAIYRTLKPIAANTPVSADTDGFLTVVESGVTQKIAERVCLATTSTHPLYPAQLVPKFYYVYTNTAPDSGTVYVRKPNTEISSSSAFSPTGASSGYELWCNAYNMDTRYSEGHIVYHLGEFYVSLTDAPSQSPAILEMLDIDEATATGYQGKYTVYSESWERALMLTCTTNTISGSGVIRVNADTDVSGFVLRNIGTSESSDKTHISVMCTVSIPGEPSEQPTGVNVLSTSNYMNWPEFSATKWYEDSSFQTNAALTSYDKQDYSAVMVFKHFGDEEHYRYKNIINYDGPDADQGLCILLPVTITDEDNVTHDPADGSMIDFLFNIWPNHKYDGRSVNDLIINKSQIYVYSVPDYSEYKINGFTPNTVEPIAKFSMARLVNFYVFSENVGVPDRPTVYKARFIYSKAEKRWKTYDYYQFPDHIFLSPHGFVDPSDPKAYSVQTAGFPLFQNPFSSFDLSAIHVDPEKYRNQLQNPDISPNADGETLIFSTGENVSMSDGSLVEM